MTNTSLPDGDYTLADGSAWVAVKGFAIRIATTAEGVAVDIYRKGDEMADAIASCYAFDSEAEPREDHFRSDAEADADVLASAGYGTDEDYGYYGGEQ